jgi:hypothetical protein
VDPVVALGEFFVRFLRVADVVGGVDMGLRRCGRAGRRIRWHGGSGRPRGFGLHAVLDEVVPRDVGGTLVLPSIGEEAGQEEDRHPARHQHERRCSNSQKRGTGHWGRELWWPHGAARWMGSSVGAAGRGNAGRRRGHARSVWIWDRGWCWCLDKMEAWERIG